MLIQPDLFGGTGIRFIVDDIPSEIEDSEIEEMFDVYSKGEDWKESSTSIQNEVNDESDEL